MSETTFNQAATAFDEAQERFLTGIEPMVGGNGMANGKRDDQTPPDLSLALVNYPDLMALQIPERARHLPWLPEGGNVMVFGPRGIGKTFLQLALGVSLTNGKDLLKWKVQAPVGVLYCDGEMQLDELRERATALMDTPPVAPFEFLTSQLVYQRCGGKDLILTSHGHAATDCQHSRCPPRYPGADPRQYLLSL